MLVVIVGYVAFANPDILDLRVNEVPTQTYEGSIDMDTHYYEMKRTDDYTVSMWVDGVQMDDMKLYNNELTKQELRYLYIQDNDDWSVNYTTDMEWNDDGSKLYVTDGDWQHVSVTYNCSDYDVGTCSNNWDTERVPDSVVVTSVSEDVEENEEFARGTGLFDYLFR